MDNLKSQLNNYTSDYQSEVNFKERMLDLLNEYNELAFSRKLLKAHFTGSAWIVDTSYSHILLIHHAKLMKWLQPGGHADGETNLLAVSFKELTEETGLKNIRLLNHEIFDLDIHTIPKKNDVPAHEHYDVRYLYIANDPNEVKINNESLDYQWVPINKVKELTDNQSILRMVEKTLRLKNS